MAPTTTFRTCPLCEATCGLRLTVEDGRVLRVDGDPDDVLSRGYLCPKGATIGELNADPDRLQRPLVRRGGRLVEVDWPDAYAEVAARLPAIQEQHGREAVAVYLGNPNVHNLAGQLYLRPLVKALATRNVYTASSVDQLPKHASSGLMFGDPLAIPVPDIDRTDLLVIFGGNPRVSNGSLWTAPDLPGRLDALRRRGGRLIVVDPRRTRTAARADHHLAVLPGTDAALLAAMVQVLMDDGLVRMGRLAELVAGLDDLADAVAPFTPERVADACGVEAATIRWLARELADADRAAVYGRLGTTTVRHGTVASWLVDVVNLLAGHLDQAGGAMFPRPAHHRPRGKPFRLGRWTSRVRGLPEVIGELPVATLADEIETPGEGQVRALIVVAGNPVVSTPDAGRLDRLLGQLDLLVAVDPYVTATSRHADVILPPPGVLERAHYDLAFTNFMVRNVANYSPPTLPAAEGQPDEWEILLALAAIALGQQPPVDIDAADDFVAHQTASVLAADPTARTGGLDPTALLAEVAGRRGPERQLDLLLRAGPYGDGFGEDPEGLSLARVAAAPHGIDLGPLQPALPRVLRTESGHVEVAPPVLLAALQELEAEVGSAPPDGLVLIGRRHLRTNNSWGNNVASLRRGRELCTLQIHPIDAKDRGLEDGGRATVTSRVGVVEVTVEISDDLRPGVVSLPHGFGHDLDGIRLTVARQRPGVNSNRLTDPLEVDAVSGTAVLNGIPVEVAAAAAR